jgi:hypothetical protein
MKFIADIFKYFIGFLAALLTLGIVIGVVGLVVNPSGLGLIAIAACLGGLLILGPSAILLVIMNDMRQLVDLTQRGASINSRELSGEETPYSSPSRNEPNMILITLLGAMLLVGAGLSAAYFYFESPSHLSLVSKKPDPAEEIEAIIDRKMREADALTNKRNAQ